MRRTTNSDTNGLTAATLTSATLLIITTVVPTSTLALWATVIFGTSLFIHHKADSNINLGSIYAFSFGIFQVGLLASIAFSIPFDTFSDIDPSLAGSNALMQAAKTYAIAHLTFDTAYFALRAYVLRKPSPADRYGGRLRPGDSSVVAAAGAAIFSLSVVAWFVIAYRAGALSPTITYQQFLSRTQLTPLPFTYLAMGTTFPLTAVSSGLSRRVGLTTFTLWSIPAFILGLRGEVLVPGAIFLAIYARHHGLRLRPWMLGATAVALAAGSAVRASRNALSGIWRWSATDFSPISGIQELGYSIRPTVVVIRWHESGEPLVGYGTYLNPVRRLLRPILPASDVPSAANDPSAFNSVMSSRVGNIGGSPIAEALRAGGITGVVVVMCAIALLISLLDTRERGIFVEVVFAGVAFSLLVWVRNTFVPVPFQIALVFVLAATISTLANRYPMAGRANEPKFKNQRNGSHL